MQSTIENLENSISCLKAKLDFANRELNQSFVEMNRKKKKEMKSISKINLNSLKKIRNNYLKISMNLIPKLAKWKLN